MKTDDNGKSSEINRGQETLEPIPGLLGTNLFTPDIGVFETGESDTSSEPVLHGPAPHIRSLPETPGRFIMRYGVGHTNLEQFEFAKITKDLGILRDCTVTVDRDHNVVVEHSRKTGIRDASANPSRKPSVNQQGGSHGL